jgi:hypothetical protein
MIPEPMEGFLFSNSGDEREGPGQRAEEIAGLVMEEHVEEQEVERDMEEKQRFGAPLSADQNRRGEKAHGSRFEVHAPRENRDDC